MKKTYFGLSFFAIIVLCSTTWSAQKPSVEIKSTEVQPYGNQQTSITSLKEHGNLTEEQIKKLNGAIQKLRIYEAEGLKTKQSLKIQPGIKNIEIKTNKANWKLPPLPQFERLRKFDFKPIKKLTQLMSLIIPNAEAGEYGMPLTPEEKEFVRENFTRVALDISASAVFNEYPQIKEEREGHSVLFPIRDLAQRIFPVEPDTLFPGHWTITEATLLRLADPNSCENIIYNDGIIYEINLNIYRLTRVKEIINNYPGISKTPKNDWLAIIDDHIRYHNDLKSPEWSLGEAYEYAKSASPDDDTYNTLDGDDFLEQLEQFDEVAKNLAYIAEIFR